MFTLYHCANARSFRPLWMLEECGLDYDLKLLPFPPRWQKPEYLQENPLGTIPLFIDGETRMTESAAICEYLASKYGPAELNVTPDDPAYGAYLNALHYGEATLTFPQAVYLRYTVVEREPRRLPQAAEDYKKFFLGRLPLLESILETRDYVATDRFTAADVSVAYALLLATSIGITDTFPGKIQNYWDRMKERPAFKRAKAAQKRPVE